MTGEPGVRVDVPRTPTGAELFAEDRRSTALVWFGGDAPIEAAAASSCCDTIYTPEETGEVLLGFAGANPGRALRRRRARPRRHARHHGHRPRRGVPQPAVADRGRRRATEAGTPVDVRAEFTLEQRRRARRRASARRSASRPTTPTPTASSPGPPGRPRPRMSRSSWSGTNSKVESEGYDRETSTCPAARTTSSARSSAANPRTIVVVNAGSPVALPWADDVAAVVQGYFGGQEFGAALADVLTGAAEPGGRLPTTWPAALADVPVHRRDPAGRRARLRRGHPHRLPRVAARRMPSRRSRSATASATRRGRGASRSATAMATRGDPGQHRRPRRQAGRAGLRRARRTPRSSAPSAGSSASPSSQAEPGETVTGPVARARPSPRALGRRVGRRARRLHAARRRIGRRPAAAHRVDGGAA